MATTTEKLEIERLISAAADEGMSAEQSARLETLLLDRPDLQDFYARVMSLHTLLIYELNLAMQEFSPLVADEPESRSPRVRPMIGLHDGLDAARRGGKATIQWSPGWRFAVGAAATLLAVVGAHWATRTSESPVTSAATHLTADSQAISLTSRLTQTTVSGMTFPVSARAGSDESILCGGMVWMERGPGLRERGYMMAVPPGALITLEVDAESAAQNALTVIEFDQQGRPTGGTISFNNRKERARGTFVAGIGCIANWSDRNDSEQTKYFLLTGTHMLQKAIQGDRWRLSDYKVLLESPKLVCLGWDDSGYSAAPHPSETDYYADRDFDDISAIIQVHQSTGTTHDKKQLTLLPTPQLTGQREKFDEKAYSFSVNPGESAILRIAGRAGWHNTAAVIDTRSGNVIWRQSGSPDPSQYSGAYLIENATDEPRRFAIVGAHLPWPTPGQDTNWGPSEMSVVRDDPDFTMVGFEDGGGDADFDDILIYIRRFECSDPLVGDKLY